MANELYHHGVKGMKWGRRKKKTSASEKETHAEKKARIKEQRANETPEEREKRVKKNIKKGAKITAAALAGITTSVSAMVGTRYVINNTDLAATNEYVQYGATLAAGMLGSYLGTMSVGKLLKI